VRPRVPRHASRFGAGTPRARRRRSSRLAGWSSASLRILADHVAAFDRVEYSVSTFTTRREEPWAASWVSPTTFGTGSVPALLTTTSTVEPADLVFAGIPGSRSRPANFVSYRSVARRARGRRARARSAPRPPSCDHERTFTARPERGTRRTCDPPRWTCRRGAARDLIHRRLEVVPTLRLAALRPASSSCACADRAIADDRGTSTRRTRYVQAPHAAPRARGARTRRRASPAFGADASRSASADRDVVARSGSRRRITATSGRAWRSVRRRQAARLASSRAASAATRPELALLLVIEAIQASRPWGRRFSPRPRGRARAGACRRSPSGLPPNGSGREQLVATIRGVQVGPRIGRSPELLGRVLHGPVTIPRA